MNTHFKIQLRNLNRYKKYTFIIAIAFIILILISHSLFAQKPEDKIEALYFMKGDWELENYSKDEQNQWVLVGASESRIELLHEGKFISEHSKFLTRFGEINMISNIAYDHRYKTFKLSAMDKEYGQMDIYLGKWENAELIFTNLESDKPIKTEGGKEMHFRVTYKDLKEDSFTHLVEGTVDLGKTWFLFSKSIFKRK